MSVFKQFSGNFGESGESFTPRDGFGGSDLEYKPAKPYSVSPNRRWLINLFPQYQAAENNFFNKWRKSYKFMRHSALSC